MNEILKKKKDWLNQEIKELKQFMETNENKNTSVQNLWELQRQSEGENTEPSKPHSNK